jgi:hypothetical protein
VQSLSENPLIEVAERIRQPAGGVIDPAEVAAIESYAKAVKLKGRRAETKPLFGPD